MTVALRAETRKLLTTQVWFWMALLALGLSLLVACLVSAFTNPGDPGIPIEGLLNACIGFAVLISSVLGVIGVTGEYRHLTVTPTFLSVPRRGTVFRTEFQQSVCIARTSTFTLFHSPRAWKLPSVAVVQIARPGFSASNSATVTVAPASGTPRSSTTCPVSCTGPDCAVDPFTGTIGVRWPAAVWLSSDVGVAPAGMTTDSDPGSATARARSRAEGARWNQPSPASSARISAQARHAAKSREREGARLCLRGRV